MSNVKRYYPEEVLRLLGETYDKTGSTKQAVAAVYEKHPEYKNKLTLQRSYSALKTWRHIQQKRHMQQKATPASLSDIPTTTLNNNTNNKKKTPWAQVSESKKQTIFNEAAKLLQLHYRWSSICERLSGYYTTELPRPGNFAMLFFRENPSLRPKGKRVYTMTGKRRKNGAGGIALTITKDGNEVLSMPITAEACGRLIAQALGE